MIYRNLTTGRIEPLPYRVRMPNGTTRTDPSQWGSDLAAVAAAGFEVTQRTPEDDAYDAARGLSAARSAKSSEIDAYWSALVASGWEVPGESYALGIDVDDVALLLGAYTLSKEAASIGLPSDVTIVDIAGGTHVYDAAALQPLMLQYGSARAAVSQENAALRQRLAAATTVDEVDAIQVG